MPSLLLDDQIIPLDGPVTLGRQKTNQVQVKDEGASRVHARVYPEGDRWFIEDLNSANGTKLDGKKLEVPTELEEGSVIAIGRTRIVMRLKGTASSTVAADSVADPLAEANPASTAPTPRRSVPAGEIELEDESPAQATRSFPASGAHQIPATPTGGVRTEPMTPTTPNRGKGAVSGGRSPVGRGIEALAGRTLGGVRLEQFLRRDRLGAVYIGTQTALQRKVAVKVFDPAVVGGNERQLRERFLRDMGKLSAIRHEALVQVHDSGVSEGLPWVATDLAEGSPLTEHLERTLIPPDVVLRMGAQLLDALAALHAAGFVHGNLSAELIHLDETGRAQIADLGVVGLGALPDPADDALPQTAWYIGPFPVKTLEGNPRNDLYALGVILHQAFSGEIPFDGFTAGEVMRACREEPMAPLDLGWPEGVPTKRIEHLLKAFLGKDPSYHYATPAQFADELIPLIDDTTSALLLARPPSFWSRLGLSLGVKWKIFFQIVGLVTFVLVVLFLMSHLKGALA